MKQTSPSSQPTNHFYTLLAVGTFFLILTAQVFWSAIHGDGAVYSWIVREISEAGFFSNQLPNWDRTRVFAEHPYLFFYFSSLFTSLLGYSDLILKIPNFAIAALSLFIVYFASAKNAQLKGATKTSQDIHPDTHAVGLLAGYVLIINATYIMQVAQPSLDPLAQLLAFFSVITWVFYKRAFWSGLLLGLAFLTKGLEILPHLAALAALLAFQNFSSKSFSPSYFIRQIARFSLGLILPIGLWIGYDLFFWNSQWISTYWDRQFSQRFLNQKNLQSAWSLGILTTFIQVYLIETLILISAFCYAIYRSKNISTSIHYLKNILSPIMSPLTLYFFLYTFFNLLAFWLIKKDSSQHLTGVLLFGAIPVAEAVYKIWKNLNWKFAHQLALFGFALSLGYWIWFISGVQKNPDIWTAIKVESQQQKPATQKLPIVVQNDTPEGYGFFYTVQWYFPEHSIYSPEMAFTDLNGQEVLLITDEGHGHLQASKTTYPHNSKLAEEP